MTKQIQAISFAPDHIAVSYIDLPTDVRDEGRVALMHQAEISVKHPDYREDIRKIHDRAIALLEDALENWRDSEPYDPDEDDDDDERGMGE